MTRAVIDADILPAGVLSLLCGSAGDLLDHVEWSDVVAFTGGAETAGRIRSHPRVLKTGVAVNIEADSVNSSILLPDADGAAYDAFIRDVHREMTQKAGQKCTATRRMMVSEEQIDEVIEDLSDRIGRTVVGDPALASVHMGPLATRGQVDAAREGLGRLLEEADVVHGNPEGGALEGVDAGQGCFVTPLLLRARDSHGSQALHDIEVFGPVSTVMAYDGDVESAASLVRRGQGSLVASIYGDDRSQLKTLIEALAGWHGRLVLTDSKVADKAFAPGIALPHLLHGGPGRAGGGEELGGVRGMRLYQQRTAVQGNGPLIARFLDA
jgi:phenylacetic acid degradation protein PaaN